jgi:hypothetical protein
MYSAAKNPVVFSRANLTERKISEPVASFLSFALDFQVSFTLSLL